AVASARANDTRVILDVDYRPVLWGLASHSEGENRFIASDRVTARMQALLPACDIVVGTEEEIRIAGGSESTIDALRAVRAASSACIVLKRGAASCSIFPGAIPDQ